MVYKNSLLLALLVLLAQCSTVRTSTEAIKIAEAALLEEYGESVVNNYQPYKAYLRGDSIWCVWGFLEQSGRKINEDGDTVLVLVTGTPPFVYIRKKDGEIIKINPGQR